MLVASVFSVFASSDMLKTRPPVERISKCCATTVRPLLFFFLSRLCHYIMSKSIITKCVIQVPMPSGISTMSSKPMTGPSFFREYIRQFTPLKSVCQSAYTSYCMPGIDNSNLLFFCLSISSQMRSVRGFSSGSGSQFFVPSLVFIGFCVFCDHHVSVTVNMHSYMVPFYLELVNVFQIFLLIKRSECLLFRQQ